MWEVSRLETYLGIPFFSSSGCLGLKRSFGSSLSIYACTHPNLKINKIRWSIKPEIYAVCFQYKENKNIMISLGNQISLLTAPWIKLESSTEKGLKICTDCFPFSERDCLLAWSWRRRKKTRKAWLLQTKTHWVRPHKSILQLGRAGGGLYLISWELIWIVF